jgi:ribosomal protein S18 acetylase RimI-like enzyme
MVEIREAKQSELRDLAAVYRDEYSSHNIFHQEEDEVLDYLRNQDVTYLVCVQAGAVIGGVAIVEKKQTQRHSLFRFKHFAVRSAFHKTGVPEALLKEAEKAARKGKVEIHVSATETPDIEFYMANGYAIEGELSNHYRMGEKCYILAKTL